MKSFGKKLLFSVLALVSGTTVALSQSTLKQLNTTSTESQSLYAFISQNGAESKETKTSSSDFERWNFAMSVALGIIPKPKGFDAYNSSFTYDFTFGANYNFTKSFYVGARIGYGSFTSLVGGTPTYENQTHSILIPVELGAKLFVVPDNVALVPYAGLDFGFVVKSKATQGVGSNKTEIKVKGGDDVSARGRLGVRLKLWDFDLGGALVFPFSKKTYGEKGYPEVSLGFGF